MTYFLDDYRPHPTGVQIDAGVQALMLFLGIPLAIGTLGYGILLLLIPLGTWQLASAFLRAFIGRSRVHMIYFLSAITYVFVLHQVDQNKHDWVDLPKNLEVINFIFFVIIVPLIAGIWYCRYTWKLGDSVNEEHTET